MKLNKFSKIFLMLAFCLLVGMNISNQKVEADESRNIFINKDCGWRLTDSPADVQYDNLSIYNCAPITNGGSITLYKGTRYYVGTECQIVPMPNSNITINFERYSVTATGTNIGLVQMGIFYCDTRTAFCIDANDYGKSTVFINVTTYTNHGDVVKTETFSFDVYVVEPISALQVDSLEMYVGDSAPFVIKGITRDTCFSNEYVPIADKCNPLLMELYASDDDMIAATPNTIFAKKSGIATISLTYHNTFNLSVFNPSTNSNVPYVASNPSTIFTIDIYDKVKSISFDKNEKVLKVGENYYQAPIIESDGDERLKGEYEWSSSNPDVAKVDESGHVVALSAGSTEIKVTSKDTGKATGSYVITVQQSETITDNNGKNGNNTTHNGKNDGLNNGENNNTSGDVSGGSSWHTGVGTSGVIPKVSKISAKKSKKKIIVSWSAMGNYNYVVYRASKKSRKYVKIGSTSKNKFTDKKVKYGKKYFYKIITVSKENPNLTSDLSDASKTVRVIPDTSKIQSVKKTGSGCTIKMKSVSCSGYAIYVGKDKNPKTLFATISGNNATLSLRGTYYVRCRTYVKVGKKKVYSKYSKSKKIVF